MREPFTGSTARGSACLYPHLKWVTRVEYECRFGVHEGGARDAGDDLGSGLAVRALEDTAKDALLSPDLSRVEFAIGSEAGELGTRTSPTWGAVVGTARAEDEISAVVRGVTGRAKEIDVVDLAAVLTSDFLLV